MVQMRMSSTQFGDHICLSTIFFPNKYLNGIKPQDNYLTRL